jgi:hypothetical protein
MAPLRRSSTPCTSLGSRPLVRASLVSAAHAASIAARRRAAASAGKAARTHRVPSPDLVLPMFRARSIPLDDAPRRRGRRRLLALAAGAAWPFAAKADPLPEPTGSIVLTIGGKVRRTNQDGRAAFDIAMLEALPQRSFSTKTPWYAQPRKFTGPLLRDVFSFVGGQGQTIRAVALNDYRIDIPFDDVMRFDVVLARLLDDLPMTVREKGPLFMIYPFDSTPILRNALYYSRSVWQLKAIDLL